MAFIYSFFLFLFPLLNYFPPFLDVFYTFHISQSPTRQPCLILRGPLFTSVVVSFPAAANPFCDHFFPPSTSTCMGEGPGMEEKCLHFRATRYLVPFSPTLQCAPISPYTHTQPFHAVPPPLSPAHSPPRVLVQFLSAALQQTRNRLEVLFLSHPCLEGNGAGVCDLL